MAALALAISSPLPASTFQADFNAGLPAGSAIYGNAAATGGAMRIVPSTTSQTGSFVVANLTGTSNVTTFDVSCQMFTGNAGNPASPGDGWSFAWGDVPSEAWGEEGPTAFSGLIVSFDYYINGAAGELTREVTVNWNGARIGSIAYDSYSAGNTVPIHIRLRHGGLLDVSHGGNQLFKGLALPGFTGLTSPRWGLGARTGAARAEVRMDDLVITTDPILVTNTLNSGAGSLRQAIADALAAPGPNQIHFHADLTGQQLDMAGPLEIGNQTLAIDASMVPSAIILHANWQSRVIEASDTNSNLLLNRISMRAGVARSGDLHGALGGGIYSAGTLTAEDCTFYLCEATTGGAVYGNAAKAISFNRCTFRVNAASTGGSIATASTPLQLGRCTFHGNIARDGDGGAIHLSSGSCAIVHATFNGNQASANGGALACGAAAAITLTNTIVQGNTAGISNPDIHLNGASATLTGVNLIGITDSTGPAGMQAGSPNAAGQYVGSSTAAISAGLQYFGDHGGHTFTLLLKEDSLARDRATVTGSTTDQRGLPIFGVPDIGSLEAQIAAVTAQSMLENYYVEIPLSTGSVGDLTATSGNPSVVQDSSILFFEEEGLPKLYIQGEPDVNGASEITLTDTRSGEFITFLLTIQAINSMPRFTIQGTRKTYYGNEESATVAGFATVTSKGAPDEASQQVHFSVTTATPEFFTTLPAISNNGTLTYQMSASAFGTASVTVRAVDDGGTANGGLDTSDPIEFGIETHAAFTTDFTTLPTGLGLLGKAELVSGRVRLINTGSNQQGSLILDNFTGQRNVTTFDVSADITTGDYPLNSGVPADGYSFAWGDLASSSFGEEGPSNFSGLVISFDYFKGGAGGPHVAVKWQGAEIARVSYDAYTASTVPIHIRLRAGGMLDVWHAGNRVISGVQLPGFSGMTSPRWGFGARTGFFISTVSLDNLIISPIAFEVTNGAETGAGTLRKALEDTLSSLAPGPNQIQFKSWFSDSIIHIGSSISVHLQNVLIDGGSLSGGVTLRASPTSSHFDISSFGQLMLNRITLIRSGTSSLNTNSAIYSSGLVELRDCTIQGCVSSRVGSGVFAEAGAFYADGCTFSQNTASDGGALWIQGASTTTSLSRCTVTGNNATTAIGGGMVFLGDTLRISHCTFSGNSAPESAGGILIQSPSKLELSNTIIAGNTAAAERDLCNYSATLNLLGHNLIGAAGSTILSYFPPGNPNTAGNFAGSESNPLDARLGNLYRIGGFTSTLPLLKDSPAVNSAANSTDSTDQRGFPIVGIADIGAYESGNTQNYDRWAAEQSATPLAGDTDEDHDGWSNLMEYAFLSDPLLGNRNAPTVHNGALEFDFNSTSTDLRYEVQQSSDLDQWSHIAEVRTTPRGVLLSETGGAMIQAIGSAIHLTPAPTSERRVFWRVGVRRE